MPSRLCNLIRDLVAGNHTDIVTCDHLGKSSHADCKGTPCTEVLHGLMAFGKVHRYFLIV